MRGQAKTSSQTVTSVAFAALLGVHRNSVGNWIREGMPIAAHRGRTTELDLAAAIQWVRRRDLETYEAKLEKATSTPDIDAARVRKVNADADLAELDLAKRRGDLIPRGEAEAAWSNHVLQVRARLLSLPAHARVQGVPEPAASVMGRLIRAALETLAHPVAAETEDEEATS